MKLGLVVLNWNGKEVTPRCLDSIPAPPARPIRLSLLITPPRTGRGPHSRRYPQVALIVTILPRLRRGNNVGIRYLLERAFDLVLLLNNDAVVDPDCLRELKRAAETQPAAAYGATIYELSAQGESGTAAGRSAGWPRSAARDRAGDAPAHPADGLHHGCCLMFGPMRCAG